MTKVNLNYGKLPGTYLFSEIARRVAAFRAENPGCDIIPLGIGDVTRPLAPAIIQAMHVAVDEMGSAATFRGYGPEQGYDFLREKIAEHDFRAAGADIAPDEVFVSDGAKSDCGNIGDLFDTENKVAICDPVYPVYADTNAMAGRAGNWDPDTMRWSNLVYMNCVKENGFIPEPPQERADVVYLCFPNNPTGAVATRGQLEAWVKYARENESLLLFDAAYEAFITQPEIPHSIFEIEGAKQCAIEFRSFSKKAGFTGTRCAYTVVPKELRRNGMSLHAMWNRRQCTKFNGVPYVVQRAAEAVYSKEGMEQTKADIAYYLENAKTIRAGLEKAGLSVFGGVNAPYIWAETPAGMDSWGLFDVLLKEANVVTTPGAGFGPCGEGYIRLSAFGDAKRIPTAMERIQKALGK